ncbi:sugar nucleotide-binding protein [Streptomyces sp900116325]|uniref:Sugar nucleotide-binding protein n=1 Tax=Streptomyces sp. 900116325 TaxID=3154295 RepID=A0ABV2UEK2_9ACTN
MTTSWPVTGAGGLLGREVLAELGADTGAAETGLGRDQLDVPEPRALRAVVNGAAWTDVDGAEQAEAAATGVNGTGVRRLARLRGQRRSPAARLHRLRFPGDARQPYPKTHRAVPSTRTGGASWRRASSGRAAAPHRLDVLARGRSPNWSFCGRWWWPGGCSHRLPCRPCASQRHQGCCRSSVPRPRTAQRRSSS